MKPPSIAPAYAFIYPLLCEVAREHGYALALHGTLARDMDLLAAPWVENPTSAEVLCEALMKVFTPYLASRITGPEQKPHGRLAWNLILEGGAFIDLSVMPTTA